MRILTACPHSLRKSRSGEVYDTLGYWLPSVKALDGTDLYCFLNDTPYSTLDIPCSHEDFGFTIDARNHETRMASVEGRWYERFVTVRNRVLEFAIDNNYDYLFSVDSDLVIRPGTIARLFEVKDIALAVHKPSLIAILVNNQIRDRMVYPKAIYNFGVRIDKRQTTQARGRHFKRGALIKPPYTGACSLIDLRFIREHGIRYSCCKNGEDLGFCNSIHQHGGECWIDTSAEYEAYHIQEPWLMSGAERYISGITADEAYKQVIDENLSLHGHR